MASTADDAADVVVRITCAVRIDRLDLRKHAGRVKTWQSDVDDRAVRSQ